MKFRFIIIMLLIPFFYSCNPSEKKIIKKANELAYTFLQDIPVDSIAILSVEKVTAMRYAEIVFEMMETMEYEYDMLYEEAISNEEIEKAEIFEQDKKEVIAIKEFCFSGIVSKFFNEKEVILYMVQFMSFEEDYTENGYFLMTPKFTLHELDPFRDNLLK